VSGRRAGGWRRAGSAVGLVGGRGRQEQKRTVEGGDDAVHGENTLPEPPHTKTYNIATCISQKQRNREHRERERGEVLPDVVCEVGIEGGQRVQRVGDHQRVSWPGQRVKHPRSTVHTHREREKCYTL